MANGWRRKRQTPAEAARRAKYASPEHRAAKAALRPLVAAGQAHCWRCHKPITPGTPWHVGHDDHNVNVIRGAEHATCNHHAACSKGARVANAKRAAVRFQRPQR